MILVYFLGTGIGRLLTVGFHEVRVVCQAAAASASVRFPCVLILLFLWVLNA
jgi:hypothetical protein